jgi:hypothetical protein
MKTILGAPFGFALLLLVAAAPAAAQEVDARWTPWLGCWQMLNERVREGNPAGAEAVAEAAERRLGTAGDVTVCVAPTSRPAAVALTTRAGGEPVLEQTLAADGTVQSTDEGGCTGTQRAEWAREGRRLFARAELSCAGQPVRSISGIATIATDGTWVDVQAMEIDGRTSVRVRRYRRAEGERRGGAPWTIEDVKDAAGKVSPTALEAALIESNARFRLSGRALVELDEANVPDGVIDLMVALSYPDKFQIERRAEASVDQYPMTFGDAQWSGYMGYGPGYPYFSWYPGYYGNYGYYYSPFGYGYSGYYGGFGGYYPGGIVTVPVGPDEPQASGDGRVVNGVGYTRVRPRQAQTADSGGDGRSGTSSRGRATIGGYSAGDDSSSGGSSGGAGGSGSSGGGESGGSGGRTAQPR